jgi:hypothetical protein
MEPLIAGAETVSNNSPEALEFRELKKRFPGRETLSELVKDFGIVYVTSITRRGCSGCETQKPLFRELAGKMVSDYAGKVHFTNVHVQYGEDEKEESWESKRIFRHAAYPTYMIHVRSKAGPLEVFRAVYPSMEESEKQVRETFELADFYRNKAETRVEMKN